MAAGASSGTRVLMQARTDSSRLPAKSLLTIGGLPLAALCALRASNSGLDVTVVTSDRADDDLLAATLQRFEVAVFRGSLDNCLDRFVSCLRDEADDTVVVRVTADNPVPDGRFIEQVIDAFRHEAVPYASTTGADTRMPYGLSAEVTLLRHLRDAWINSSDPGDLEHVTPYIRRTLGTRLLSISEYEEYGELRVTIDELTDYLFLGEVFAAARDPVVEPAAHILELAKRRRG